MLSSDSARLGHRSRFALRPCSSLRLAYDSAIHFRNQRGPLAADEREQLRAEIDAHVAHAWGNRIFIREYMATGNGAESARRAGYKATPKPSPPKPTAC